MVKESIIMKNLKEIEHEYHIYQRSRTNKTIYRCIHPTCSHYIKRELLEGKKAQCPKCKGLFLIPWQQLKNRTPVCEYCTKSPKSAELRLARDVAADAFGEFFNEPLVVEDDKKFVEGLKKDLE